MLGVIEVHPQFKFCKVSPHTIKTFITITDMDFRSVFMVLTSIGSMSLAICSNNLMLFARLHDWNVNYQQCPVHCPF